MLHKAMRNEIISILKDFGYSNNIFGGKMLKSLNWFPYNKTILEDFIKKYSSQKGIIVFDWDNTSIFNDIGEACFFHLVTTLQFKISPDNFEELIPDQVKGIKRINYNNQFFELFDLKKDLLKDYEKLYSLIVKNDIHKAFSTAEYSCFRLTLLLIYLGFKNTLGIESSYAYYWVVRFFQGFTIKEIKAFSKEVFNIELTKPIEKLSINAFPVKKSDELFIKWPVGIRVFPEIINLFEVLRKSDFKVCIVTASLEYIVQSIAEEYGFLIPNNRVFGLRLKENNNILSNKVMYNDDYPLSVHEGKVRIIQNNLPSEPLMVAGDSNTDFEMLTQFTSTKLRLLINCKHTGNIEKLYEKAYNSDSGYILQGRDESTGSFRPFRETINS